MPTTYYLDNISASGFPSGGSGDSMLQVATTVAAESTISLSNLPAENGYQYDYSTPSGVPGTSGTSTGTFSLKLTITAADSNMDVLVYVKRYNSSGTEQASVQMLYNGTDSNAIVLGSTGTYNFSIVNPALGTWASGNRATFSLVFFNSSMHSSASVTYALRSANAEVVTPWGAATNTKTYTLQSYTKDTNQKQYTIQSYIQETFTKTHSVDAYINPVSKSHSIDSIIAFNVSYTFNGGSDETTITTSDTGSGDQFFAITNAAPGSEAVYDSAWSKSGQFSGRFTGGTGGGGFARWEWNNTTGGTTYFRGYFRGPSSAPAANLNILQPALDGTAAGAVRIDATTGVLRIIDSTFSGPSSPSTFAFEGNNEVIRIELSITHDTTSGSMEARLFYGANIDGDTPDETLSISGKNTLSGYDAMRIGMITGSGPSVWWDEVAWTNVTWIGPLSTSGALQLPLLLNMGGEAPSYTTKTHSVDSLFSATLSKTQSIDSLLQMSFTETHSVDSLIKAILSETYFIESLLAASMSKTHSIDSVIGETATITHSVDSLTEATLTKTHAVDSLTIASFTETHDVDSLIRATLSKTHLIDSLTRATLSKTHSSDSLIEATLSKSHSIDSLTEATMSEAHVIESLIQATISETHDIDSLTKASLLKTHSVDSLMKATLSETHLIDSLMKATLSETHGVDSELQATQTLTKTYSIDSLTKAVLEKTYATDSLINITSTESYVVESLIQASLTKSHVIDSLIQAAISNTYSLESLIKETSSKTHSVDSLMKATLSNTYSVDSLNKTALLKTHSLDTRIVTAAGLVYDDTYAAHGTQSAKVWTGTDAGTSYVEWTGLSISGSTVLYSRIYLYYTGLESNDNAVIRYLDGATSKAGVEITSGGNIRIFDSTGTKDTSTATIPTNQWFRIEFNTDANASTAAMSASLYSTMDSTTPTETISSSTGNTGTQFTAVRFGITSSVADYGPIWMDDLAADTSSIGPYTKTKTHSLDGLTRVRFTKTHLLESLIKATSSETHTTDSLIKASLIKTHALDSITKTTSSKTHSLDSSLEKTLVVTHALDSLTRESFSVSTSLDSLISFAYDVSHQIDILQKKTLTISTALSSVLFSGTQVFYQIDSLTQKALNVQHDIDGLIEKQFSVSGQIDASLSSRVSSTTSIDAKLSSQIRYNSFEGGVDDQLITVGTSGGDSGDPFEVVF